MLRISRLAELDAWLHERSYFEDDYLTRIEESSDGAVTLTLEQCVQLGLRPGDVSVLEVYELRAGRPTEFEAPAHTNTGDVVEGFDTHSRGGRLVIEIDVGRGQLRLVADEVTVGNVATERRRTQPWLKDQLTVKTAAVHDDRYWATRVSAVLGESVVWRVLGSREPRKPGLDPDGCFLQTLSRLTTTDYGVFYARSSDGARASLALRRKQDVDTDLWQAVRVVAADFDRIDCGNCVFGSADWLAYLATNEFPPDERLRGTIIA